VLALGGLAFCVTLADGALLDWGAVFLRDERGGSASLAAAGVAVFLMGIMLGRFAGDRLIERFGPTRMFQAGGALASAGFGIALTINQPLAGVIGIGLIGAGISYLLPLLFSVAGNSSDEATPAALVARVSTLGYLGSFVGPGLIGVVAGAVGLVSALTIPAILIVGAALATLAYRLDKPGRQSE
jgi:fucose permease